MNSRNFTISYPSANPIEAFKVSPYADLTIEDFMRWLSILPSGEIMKIGIPDDTQPVFLLNVSPAPRRILISNSHSTLMNTKKSLLYLDKGKPIFDQDVWGARWVVILQEETNDRESTLQTTVHWVIPGRAVQMSVASNRRKYDTGFVLLLNELNNRRFNDESIPCQLIKSKVIQSLHQLAVLGFALSNSTDTFRHRLWEYLCDNTPREKPDPVTMQSKSDGDVPKIDFPIKDYNELEKTVRSFADEFVEKTLNSVRMFQPESPDVSGEYEDPKFVAAVDTLTQRAFQFPEPTPEKVRGEFSKPVDLKSLYLSDLILLPENRIFEIHAWDDEMSRTNHAAVMRNNEAIYLSDSVPILYGTLDDHDYKEFLGIGGIERVPLSYKKFHHIIEIRRKFRDLQSYYVDVTAFDNNGKPISALMTAAPEDSEIRGLFGNLCDPAQGIHPYAPSIKRTIEVIRKQFLFWINSENYGLFQKWLESLETK